MKTDSVDGIPLGNIFNKVKWQDYTRKMETITLTVEKSLLDGAQRVAEEKQTTRDAVLNEWLTRQLSAERVRKYDELMARLTYVNAGRKFTREEMNER